MSLLLLFYLLLIPAGYTQLPEVCRIVGGDTSPNDQVCARAVGDAIYLGSGTSLADAAGWPCGEVASLLPATGQTGFWLPFPWTDVLHGGYTSLSSPTPGGLIGCHWYSLERIQLVITDEGYGDGARLIEGLWRGTPTEFYWTIEGDPSELPKVREVVVYDADGTALRFVGYRLDDRCFSCWQYQGATGVEAKLTSDETDRLFVLTGGPPGAMNQRGLWQYHFEPPEQRGWFPTRKARLIGIVDPLGNAYPFVSEPSQHLFTDPFSGAQLRFDSNTGEVKYRAYKDVRDGVDRWSSLGQVSPENSSECVSGERQETVRWGEEDPEQVKFEYSLENGGSLRKLALKDERQQTLYQEQWQWGGVEERERVLYQTAYGGLPALSGRLFQHQIGNLNPTFFTHFYTGESQFQCKVFRDSLSGTEVARLTYDWDWNTGLFTQLEVRRPALRFSLDPTKKEKTIYSFHSANGQVAIISLATFWLDDRGNERDLVVHWSEQFLYEDGQDPLALTRYIDRQGGTWQWQYDHWPAGADPSETRLTQASDPTGVQLQLNYEEQHEDLPYGGPHENPPILPSSLLLGNPETSLHRWRFDYSWNHGNSPKGQLLGFSEPGRGWWQFRYFPPGHDFQNKLAGVIDPTGKEGRISEYDSLGRPTRWEADADGNWNSSEGRFWQRVEWTLMGQPRSVEWSDGSRVTFHWNSLFLTGVTDARGRSLSFLYNQQGERGSAGLLNEIKFGNGQRFAWLRYDPYGRLERVEGGNGVGLTYRYGNRDELLTIQYDEGGSESFTYSDCCGQVASWTKPDGRQLFFDYSPNGWLREIRLDDPNHDPAFTYEYDEAGRLTQVTDPTGQTELCYDLPSNAPCWQGQDKQDTGWLRQVSTALKKPDGSWLGAYTLQYEYYPSGDVHTLTTSWGSQWQYFYDEAGRLTDLHYNGTPFAHWEYDGAGRLTSQTVQPLGRSHSLQAFWSYADSQSVGAIGTLTYQWNGQPLATFDYDGDGNEPGYYPDGTLRLAQENLAGQNHTWRWDYSYDGSLQYEQRDTHRTDFAYDAGGNLTQWGGDTGWLYQGNQLVKVRSRGWSFTYTANGERWQWVAGDVNGDGCVTDADVGQVVARYGQSCSGCPEDLNGDGVVDDADVGLVMSSYGAASWSYTYDHFGNLVQASRGCGGTYRAGYDGLGRRVWQEVNGVRTYFLYDGDTLIAEVDASSGQVVAEYVWGLQGPLARIDLQNPANTRYYVLDGLGHTRLLLDSAGQITDWYTYDAWGNPIEFAGSTPNPFTWNGAYGYEFIPFTGLYHVGAREYDPRTARWLQRDPKGTAGGHPNLYLYCQNDPVNHTDPDGTRKLSKKECEELLNKIESAMDEVEQAIKDIVPETDPLGGHPYRAGGKDKITQPLGHCEEAAGKMNHLKSLWEDFAKGGCWEYYPKGGRAGQLSKQTDNLVKNLLSKIERALEYLQAAIRKGLITAQQAKEALKRLLPHLKRLGKKAFKALLKKVPILGWVLIGYDWYTGGFMHAFNEATWPLSELWD